MPKEQRTFTKEFKLEAVQLVQRSGKSQSQVARELGIADSTLHHWCKEFADHGQQAFVGSGHQTPQEEELRRLKRELEVTRQERDILKKSSYAAALFSTKEELGMGLILAALVAEFHLVFPYPGLSLMLLIRLSSTVLLYFAAPLMSLVGAWSMKHQSIVEARLNV